MRRHRYLASSSGAKGKEQSSSFPRRRWCTWSEQIVLTTFDLPHRPCCCLLRLVWKRVIDILSCDSSKHCWILTTFWQKCFAESRPSKWYTFPIHLTIIISTLPCKTEDSKWVKRCSVHAPVFRKMVQRHQLREVRNTPSFDYLFKLSTRHVYQKY